MTGAGTLYLYTLSYFIPIELVLEKGNKENNQGDCSVNIGTDILNVLLGLLQ